MEVLHSEICGHETVSLSRSSGSEGSRVVIYHTGGGETAQAIADPTKRKRPIFEALTSAGYFVASITSSTDHWGSPESIHAHDLLYDRVAPGIGDGKIAIFCQSMGGLSAYNWTFRHPERVLGIYGIYPVTNLASMMDGKLRESIKGVYSRQGINIHDALAEYDPIRQIGSVDLSGIPAKHRHGDSDLLVKFEENAVKFARVYTDFGGSLELVTIRGLGHEANPAFFDPEEVLGFLDSLDWGQ